jgi:plastocyanin
MRTLYVFAFAGSALFTSAQTPITTLNSNTFSPDVVTIQLGESVQFNIGSIHTATQVSEATWMANDSDPLSGGFNFSSGSHIYTPTEIGTIYYVCQPHANMGMKGRIIVETNTTITEVPTPQFRIYPNPAVNEISIESSDAQELILIDVQGREVMKTMLKGNDTVDVSSLPEGNYTATLRNTGGDVVATQRIAIVR